MGKGEILQSEDAVKREVDQAVEKMRRELLVKFQIESNRIEGIRGARTVEVDALEAFISLPRVEVADVLALGRIFTDKCQLRDRPGMDVYVGAHVPPQGGPRIPQQLAALLDAAHLTLNPQDVYRIHVEFETLHPFMDGNGRTGRALTLWQEEKAERPRMLALGFLHAWYYRSLTVLR
jgi:hypothetical protein